MISSSLDKEFTLNTKESVNKFVDAFVDSPKSINIDRSVTSKEVVERGIHKLKKSSSGVKKSE